MGKTMMAFLTGDEVEVSSDDEGFRGAWSTTTPWSTPLPLPMAKMLSLYERRLSGAMSGPDLVPRVGSPRGLASNRLSMPTTAAPLTFLSLSFSSPFFSPEIDRNMSFHRFEDEIGTEQIDTGDGSVEVEGISWSGFGSGFGWLGGGGVASLSDNGVMGDGGPSWERKNNTVDEEPNAILSSSTTSPTAQAMK